MSTTLRTRAAALLLAALASLTACTPEPASQTLDQCLRLEIFKACMAALPTGPAATKYSDWDEVVHECGYQATNMAWRPAAAVTPACTPGKP